MRGFFSRFNNKHFLSLAGNGFVAFFGLFTFSIICKSAPTLAEAGHYFFFLSVLSLFDALRGGFLQTATIKFYAGAEPERGKEILGSVWFLAILLTGTILLLNGAAYYGLRFVSNDALIIIIKWLGITFLSTLPFNLVYWKLQADEHYGKLLRLKLVNSGSTLVAFATLAVTKRMTLESLLLYNMLTNCFTSLIALVATDSGISTIADRSRVAIMELVNYGKYSLASTFSSTLLGSVDNFIITFMLGPAALAIYQVPMKLMQIIEILLLSFVGTGMSGMAIAFNHKNMHQVTYILKKYAGMLTIAFIPLTILAFFFADTATYIAVLGRHDFTGTAAANIFRLYMLFCLLYPIDRFNGATLDIIHKPQINLYKVLIMLVINIAGDFAGIAIFKDLYGIAYAALITHLSGIIYGYFMLNKYMPVSVRGIINTGYSEMVTFIRQQLKLAPKA